MTPDELKTLAASGSDLPAVAAGLTGALKALGADMAAAAEAITEASADRSLDKAVRTVAQIAAARRMLEVANQEAGELLDVAIYVAGVVDG